MPPTSRQFYKKVGVKWLAARKEQKHTKTELAYLKRYLNKKQKILDLACGYGRFTIPLAEQGYNVEGIDISPNLIREAKKNAKKEKVGIKFRIGDMRKLPYTNDSFDSIICMWSAFSEIHKRKDQISALSEMHRVLKVGGFAFLEMPKPIKNKNRIIHNTIEGIKASPMYIQDKKSIKDLMKVIKPSKYKAFVDYFGGRQRFLVIFWK